jgi:hypothetical protein
VLTSRFAGEFRDTSTTRDLAKPVGISSYITKLVDSLPKEFRGSLPSPEELETELTKPE